MVVEEVSKGFWRLTVGHGHRQLIFYSNDGKEHVTRKWERYVRDKDFDKYRVTSTTAYKALEHYSLKDLN